IGRGRRRVRDRRPPPPDRPPAARRDPGRRGHRRRRRRRGRAGRGPRSARERSQPELSPPTKQPRARARGPAPRAGPLRQHGVEHVAARYDLCVTDAVRKLLDDAMALPSEDRARVAAALLASLDEAVDEDATSAWAAEIERRADRVLAGDS